MRILFIPATLMQLYDKMVEERPIGGTETAIIRLAQALADKGAEVTVVTRHPNPPLSNPLYLPLNQVEQIGEMDVMIVLRDFSPFFWKVKATKRFYWTGDSFDQPITIGLGDKRIITKIDGFLAVSKWQAQSMCKASGYPKHKAFALGNGIHLPYYDSQELRSRHRLIYSSTPYRGLEHLLRLFPHIQERVPQAELKIFSGLDVYANNMGSFPEGYETVAAKLRRMQEAAVNMPGVSLEGNVVQAQLAKEFQCSAILAYPNTFEETSCITAMEAIAAGCVPVTSNKGALPETIGRCGILIDGNPGEPQYDSAFVEACVSLLSDDDKFNSFSESCAARKEELGWDSVAERLLNFCKR